MPDAAIGMAQSMTASLAFDPTLAIASFSPDGTILRANDKFGRLFDAKASEVVGLHHKIFVTETEAGSEAYRAFWTALRRGEGRSAEYRRLRGDGSELWMEAIHAPLLDGTGRPFEILTIVSDITARKRAWADHQGQVTAINMSQCVIHFAVDGTIIDANQNFLNAVGYRREEVLGRHHRMFVPAEVADTEDYARFWETLRGGTFMTATYKRIGKDGREVWLQASYNPIFDLGGRPFKVVKYATDVTLENLRRADAQGQIAAIHKSTGAVAFDLDGTIIDANQNFLDAVGYRREEVLGRHHRMFVPPGVADTEDYARFWETLRGGTFLAATYKRIGKDGREVWLQASYNPIFDLSGRLFKVVKYATDVTQENLRRADAQGQIAAIHKSTGAVAFDLGGIIIDANQNFLDAVGYRREEVLGHHHRMFVPPEVADAEDYARFWDTLRSGTFLAATYKRIGKDGREVWLQASYNPILDLNGKPFKVVKYATDVTADIRLAEAFRDVERQAQHDVTTALPNRTRLASFMTTGLGAPGARMVILYLDLDRFKPINDLFGHATGDRVLGEVADRLRRCVNKDQLVARVGGDEFVVAAPNLPQADIHAFCQRLIDAVTAPIRHDGRELTVGLSIGVAVSPDDATTPDELLRCADVALYRSKAYGRGCYSFFTVETSDQAAQHRTDMRGGIETDERRAAYQPRPLDRSAAVTAMPSQHGA